MRPLSGFRRVRMAEQGSHFQSLEALRKHWSSRASSKRQQAEHVSVPGPAEDLGESFYSRNPKVDALYASARSLYKYSSSILSGKARSVSCTALVVGRAGVRTLARSGVVIC